MSVKRKAGNYGDPPPLRWQKNELILWITIIVHTINNRISSHFLRLIHDTRINIAINNAASFPRTVFSFFPCPAIKLSPYQFLVTIPLSLHASSPAWLCNLINRMSYIIANKLQTLIRRGKPNTNAIDTGSSLSLLLLRIPQSTLLLNSVSLYKCNEDWGGRRLGDYEKMH